MLGAVFMLRSSRRLVKFASSPGLGAIIENLIGAFVPRDFLFGYQSVVNRSLDIADIDQIALLCQNVYGLVDAAG
ncbi:hypothetical protein EWV21_23145 [Escherichia coli]|uniref:Uncharacterized protein n=1 Tax=Escherichia coli TaxID=562 RepID=A0AAX0PRL0_ECOLX|nr:hypothetical protein [Escherichia coli]EFO2062329.1 hypothetical protein [Escherichia coli O8]MMK05743.1 hypothetical protein [Shigella sonnei]ATB12471.1 hypothetical protein CJU63_03000 [Escherichia coli]EEY5316881.1 hypothetical protein [Escherichia coli]EEY5912637.1 hypothetical protein [Escherichia coli]